MWPDSLIGAARHQRPSSQPKSGSSVEVCGRGRAFNAPEGRDLISSLPTAQVCSVRPGPLVPGSRFGPAARRLGTQGSQRDPPSRRHRGPSSLAETTSIVPALGTDEFAPGFVAPEVRASSTAPGHRTRRRGNGPLLARTRLSRVFGRFLDQFRSQLAERLAIQVSGIYAARYPRWVRAVRRRAAQCSWKERLVATSVLARRKSLSASRDPLTLAGEMISALSVV